MTSTSIKKNPTFHYFMECVKQRKVELVIVILLNVAGYLLSSITTAAEWSGNNEGNLSESLRQNTTTVLFIPLFSGLIFMAAIVAVNSFLPLNSLKDRDMLWSLPINKRKMISLNFAAGAGILIIPTALTALISNIILYLSCGSSSARSEFINAVLWDLGSRMSFVELGLTYFWFILSTFLVVSLVCAICSTKLQCYVFSIMLCVSTNVLSNVLSNGVLADLLYLDYNDAEKTSTFFAFMFPVFNFDSSYLSYRLWKDPVAIIINICVMAFVAVAIYLLIGKRTADTVGANVQWKLPFRIITWQLIVAELLCLSSGTYVDGIAIAAAFVTLVISDGIIKYGKRNYFFLALRVAAIFGLYFLLCQF